MSIFYKVAKVTQPGIPGGGMVRFKARVAGRRKYKFDEFSKDLAKRSTVSTVDSTAMLSALNTLVPEKLLEGYIVDFGDFGSFRLEIQSTAKDTPEEVNRFSIKKATIHFLPGIRLRKEIKNASFIKVKPKPIRKLALK